MPATLADKNGPPAPVWEQFLRSQSKSSYSLSAIRLIVRKSYFWDPPSDSNSWKANVMSFAQVEFLSFPRMAIGVQPAIFSSSTIAFQANANLQFSGNCLAKVIQTQKISRKPTARKATYSSVKASKVLGVPASKISSSNSRTLRISLLCTQEQSDTGGVFSKCATLRRFQTTRQISSV